MSSYSKHPDDEALERWIEQERFAFLAATTMHDRRRAWQSLKDLLAQRSRREIAAREAAMRGLHV